ncbi:hypothetical protein N9937_00625 [bacterium]|nr:hypothetical protein [bacterium]
MDIIVVFSIGLGLSKVAPPTERLWWLIFIGILLYGAVNYIKGYQAAEKNNAKART